MVADLLDIVGNDDSVNHELLARGRIVGLICIPAGRLERRKLLLRQCIQAKMHTLRQIRARIRVSPACDIRLIIRRSKIMVEISADDQVIACSDLRSHLLLQHVLLPFPDRIGVTVSGQMHVDDDELLPVLHRDPGNGVAAVKIDQLAQTLRNREAPAKSRCNIKLRIGTDSGMVLPVRLCQRIHEERRVIIHSEDIRILGKDSVDELLLIDMIASRPVRVDLLEHHDLRIQAPDELRSAGDGLIHALLALRPGRLSPVHKERKIRCVRAEPYIIRDDIILFPHRTGFRCTAFCDIEVLLISDSVISPEHIQEINSDNQNKRDQYPCNHTQCYVLFLSDFPFPHFFPPL